MTFSSLSGHVRRWNVWRKRNRNNKLYKLCVLLGILNSPSMDHTIPIKMQHRYKPKY